ncbi:hypothetical protein ACFQZE_07100 [Paenibacillus sp. GCM10027627]|uniref:hypothetical protein n=1 Tax=unclassified Paenibacillus TaxID=185978 RepID=UPI00363A584D
MRKSLKVLEHMIQTNKNYDGLPTELEPFYVYLTDSGHSVMGIVESLLDSTKYNADDLYSLESAIPVKYVLEHSYKLYHGHLLVNVPHHNFFGTDIEEEYYEY